MKTFSIVLLALFLLGIPRPVSAWCLGEQVQANLHTDWAFWIDATEPAKVQIFKCLDTITVVASKAPIFGSVVGIGKRSFLRELHASGQHELLLF